jgi:hypothetical protein
LPTSTASSPRIVRDSGVTIVRVGSDRANAPSVSRRPRLHRHRHRTPRGQPAFSSRIISERFSPSLSEAPTRPIPIPSCRPRPYRNVRACGRSSSATGQSPRMAGISAAMPSPCVFSRLTREARPPSRASSTQLLLGSIDTWAIRRVRKIIPVSFAAIDDDRFVSRTTLVALSIWSRP